ncbi:MAG: hypothetical protein KC413_18785 [Anaerolineales bacterium]|nr:hypothetical protein [Anaerolineales bacterium]
MHRNLRLFWLFSAILYTFSWLATAQAQNGAPANVTLSDFAVYPLDDAVRIDWSTDTEIDLAGFFLQRADNGGPFVDLDSVGFIPGTGGDVTGDDYSVTDNTAVNGQTYTYKLFELETTGSAPIALAEETVTLTGPSPTPVTIGGGNTGLNPTNTPIPSNPTATATRQTTNTPTATATRATSVASATPRATTSPTAVATATSVVAPPSPTAPVATIEVITPTPLPTATDVPFVTPTLFPTPTTMPTDTPVSTGEDGTELTTPPTPIPDNVVFAQAEELLAQAVPIGAQPAYPGATAVPVQTQTDNANSTSNGRLILWASFLAAALLFIASVIGSIILFTRKQAGEHKDNIPG